MPLQVAIRTTGALRDVLGPRRALALPDDATVADLLAFLGALDPAAAEALGRTVVSIGGATVDRGRALADGDEVALILPVAGGALSPRAPR
jgi:molybdopterin synthase catalytic subunit/molybdopterin synthase sulfur carrier subunit